MQQGRRQLPALVGGVAALVTLAAPPARAQSAPAEGIWVSGSVFADVRRFSGDPTSNVLDGRGTGGAVAVGTSLGARWDLEVGLEVPSSTATTEDRPMILRRGTVTLRSRTRNQPVSVSALLRFRGAPGRLQVGYLAGLSLVRLRRQFDTLALADGLPDALVPRPLKTIDYDAAPTLGVDVRVEVARHVSIVPAVHVSVLGLSDVSALLLRPRIGVRWTF